MGKDYVFVTNHGKNHDGVRRTRDSVTQRNHMYFHVPFYSCRRNSYVSSEILILPHHCYKIMVVIRPTAGSCFFNALIKQHMYYYIRNLFNMLTIAFQYNFFLL